MKATFSIEFIGADSYRKLEQMYYFMKQAGGKELAEWFGRPKGKPWVAEIGGNDPHYKYKRTFLKPNWDYSDSNSKGSRGIRLWFVLESGRLYEVFRHISWKNSERGFVSVTENGDIYWLDDEEAKEWLNALSEKTS